LTLLDQVGGVYRVDQRIWSGSDQRWANLRQRLVAVTMMVIQVLASALRQDQHSAQTSKQKIPSRMAT